MDIVLYLSELLQQRTSVGITGLGTFFKKKFAGRYDKEKQSFLPPGYFLQFTSEVKDDNFLLNLIAEKRNISKESAGYYIAQFVEETNKKLEIDHEAELENIGRLFFTEHEGLSFEPSKIINYGSEFFGLPPIADTETLPESHETVEIENQNAGKPENERLQELAEPTSSKPGETNETPDWVLPIVENIELDEVKDDLKNTLANSGHEIIDVEHEEVSVPDFVKEQHAEHPNRFGHQPESELPKTYRNLVDEDANEEKIVEAPEFIKEQHAEHPNRFGHDPLTDEVFAEDEGRSNWTKVWIAVFALIVIAAVIYFVKPEWFGNASQTEKNKAAAINTDSAKIQKIDSTKVKRDSVAKTDSILKANQIQNKADTVNGKTSVSSNKKVTNVGQSSMFHVIAVSYATEAAAQQYISKVKKIGLNATIAKMEGRRKKVSIASFSTKEEAEKQKNILQKRLKGEGFYVKEIKNNTQP